MFEFPLFVTVEVIDPVLPTFTLPKFSVELLNPRRRVDATPVPLKEIVSGEFGALLTNEIVPVTLPAALGAKTALNVVDWPAPRFTGAAIPEVLKPAPATVTEEIVTVALPPFVSVKVWELLVPVVTLPNAVLVGVAASCACVPVPLKLIVVGEFGALLTIEMLPLALPADVGANLALNVVLNPAPNVSGAVVPVVLKPVPAAVTAEIVTVALPPFVRVMVCELFVPVATLPNATLVGVAASCGCVPVPLKLIVVGEFGALLTIEMLPLALPADVGANLALNVVLNPAPNVSGAVIPVVLKPVPAAVTAEIVTVALPPFVRVMVCELFVPVATLPNATLVGVAASCACVPVPLKLIVVGEFGALLTIEMLPLALPADVGANLALNVVLNPAPNVSGAVVPVVLKPVPAAVTAEIVTVALPPFVRVMVCELFVPVATLPNATLVGVAASCACVPVPLKLIVVGEFGALLTIEMLPLALPADVGANLALNVVLNPAPNVSGAVIPVVLKPVPAAVTAEIVTVALPPFVRVMVCELFVPVATLPNATLVGVAASCGCVPVPLKLIVVGEFGALLTIEMLPLALPADVGANLALNVVLNPAPNVSGAVIPVVLKPVPAAVTAEIVTVAPPPFVSVMVCELFAPVATLPNATLVGVAASCGCVPVPLKLIVVGEFGALLTIEMLPLALPADVGAKLALNVVLNPAPNVSGAVIPVVLKPVPAAVTAEIVTVALPPFVSVMVCELFAPVATLPNATLVGVAASCGCVPVPLKLIVVGEFGALLTIEMLPLALPADVGANLALNVVLNPAPNVSGAVIPVVLKPAPAAVTAEIVTVALPPFVRVMVCELFVPVATLPNATLVGVAASCACVPVPLKLIVVGEFGALLTIEMLPLALPADVGANLALNVVLSPAPNVSGAVIPVVLKPVPAAVTAEIVTVALPPFVSVMVCELFVPVATLPNATLVGVAASCGCVPVPLKLIVVGEFGALLTIEMLPLALPADVGAKLALNVVLNPAPNVSGAVIPVVLKPVPAAVTAEIVTVALPPFVSVMVCELFAPVATLPNATLVGVAASCGCVPVPLKLIVVGEFGALLTIEMLPLTLPADVGANLALNVVLSPAPNVSGAVIPVVLKPVPAAVTAEIVTVAP